MKLLLSFSILMEILNDLWSNMANLLPRSQRGRLWFHSAVFSYFFNIYKVYWNYVSALTLFSDHYFLGWLGFLLYFHNFLFIIECYKKAPQRMENKNTLIDSVVLLVWTVDWIKQYRVTCLELQRLWFLKKKILIVS